MSAPATARPNHYHLPSVHVRTERGAVGFDYDEDLYVHGRGRHKRVERVVRLAAIEFGAPSLIRETRDVLCREEWQQLEENLDWLMEEGNPEAGAWMEERARAEFARQKRIAAGQEAVCRCCGCSETHACSGGCCWATETLCSRCVGGAR